MESAGENSYEFDAPKHFLDFGNMSDLDNDDADQWFDKHGETTFEDAFLPPTSTSPPTSQPKVENLPIKEEPQPVVKDEKDSIPVGRETFVVTKTVESPAAHAAIVAPSLIKKEEEVDSKKRAHEVIKKQQKTKKAVPIIKQTSFKAQHRPHRTAAQKAMSNIHTLLTPKKRTPKKTTSIKVTECQNPELVRQRNPSHTSASKAPKAKKTFEELQLDEVKRLQKETMKRLRQSRRSFANLTKSSGPLKVKGAMPTTEPVEFKFHQTTREKKGQVVKVDKSEEAIAPQKFFNTLRSSQRSDNYNPNMPTKPPTPPGGTKVKPFKFQLDNRFSHKAHNSSAGSQSSTSSLNTHTAGYQVPIAEAIARYQKATPPRFRRTIKKASSASKVSSSVDSGLTMPKTPNLTTKTRARPVTVKSAATEEEEEVEKIKQFKFKANPINPAIFTKGGLFGVPRKVPKVSFIQPQTPELATRKRFLDKHDEENEDVDGGETEAVFHAKPMPNFERVMGVPSKRPIHLTNPESPALCLKRRRLHETEEDQKEEEEMGFKFKATPLPDLDNVFKPELEPKKTEAVPFSFEQRDKDKPTRETFVEMILRKEKHPDFKAQSIPDFQSGPSLPPKPAILPTKIQPFDLQSEIRGHDYANKWQEKVEREQNEAKAAAEFRAHDAKVLYSKPFMPHQSTKPLTDTDDVVLSTEKRSMQRAAFDENLQQEARQKEIDNLKRMALREIQDRKELNEFRKSLVHKAQPVKDYAPVVIKKSTKPFTTPISPHFHTDSRIR